MISAAALQRTSVKDVDKYLDAYHQILETQECIDMWFIKVILLGAPRLGKTTTRRRLMREIADIGSSGEAEQPSTGAVETGYNVVIRKLASCTAFVTPSEWLVTKDPTDEAHMLVQFIYCKMHTLKPSAISVETERNSTKGEDDVDDVYKDSARVSGFHKPVTVDKSFEHPALPSLARRKNLVFPETLTSPKFDESESSEPNGMSEMVDLFRKALGPKYWKDIKHLFTDTAYLKMEDTGGQPEFMDMLPALTIGPALYLLFCKLTDNLQSPYTVSYVSPSGQSTLPEKSTYTVEEVLLTALASISCFEFSSISSPVSNEEAFSSDVNELLTSSNKSVAYIVGTCKDLVSEQQIAEFDKKLQDSIRSTDFFEEDLVQFSSENRMVLPIDNMHGGEDEIKALHQFLEEKIKHHFKKLSIPAAWLILSLCLRKRAKRTASLQSVLELAGHFNIPEKEAMIALWFLHHYAGVLMYFPNLPELKDTVICDNQVVYDSATNLIVNTFKFGSVGKAASERFRETGQFSLQDIRRATASVSGDYIPLQKLIKLLEHLNIIALFVQSDPRTSSNTKVMYFMPCVLQNATCDELDRWWFSNSQQHSPAPLFIRYKCGFVPIGVFPAMIAYLVSKESLELVSKGIKKNLVQFTFGSDYDKVTLISQPKYYAIHITRLPSAKIQTHEVCAEIRGIIESTLMTVTRHMNYSFSVKYQLSFECPSHPGREHLCVVNSEDTSPHIMCCQRNMKELCPVEMESQHLVWFGKTDEEECTISRVGQQSVPDFQAYVSSLPACAHSHLEHQLDWDHKGVDKDLSKIAEHMSDWEEKLSTHLGLTSIDISDTKDKYPNNSALQRREALRKWQSKHGFLATYGNLLKLCVEARHTRCAEAVCVVLRGKNSSMSTSSKPSETSTAKPVQASSNMAIPPAPSKRKRIKEQVLLRK